QSTIDIYTLSLHDALPILSTVASVIAVGSFGSALTASLNHSENSRNGSVLSVKSPDVNEFRSLMEVESAIGWEYRKLRSRWFGRSEEHTSELQSLAYLVCR